MEKDILEQLPEKQRTVLNDDVSFVRMIKEWVVKDYYTPKIKAEVLFDMLLSEEIETLLEKTICKSSNVTLLAKEFPVKTNEEEDRKSSAIDYLAYTSGSGKGKLFFVELKTAAASFKETQLGKYLQFCGTSSGENQKEIINKLFEFYKTKFTGREITSGTYKKAEKSGAAFHLSSTEKYIFQLAGMCNTLRKDAALRISKNMSDTDWKAEFDFNKGISGEEDIEKINARVELLIDGIKKKFEDYTICLVYITLKKLDTIEDGNTAYDNKEIYNIVLDEEVKEADEILMVEKYKNDKGKITVHVQNGFSCLRSETLKDIIRRIKSYTIKDDDK